MALEKGTISINMGNGIDVKADEKIGDIGTYLDLKDWQWNKLKALNKRLGRRRLGTSVSTTFPNPLSIGSSQIPSSVFAHNDQLVLQNRGALYSYDDEGNSWRFKGHYYPVQVDLEQVVTAQANVFNLGVYDCGNVLAYTYMTDVSGLRVSYRLTLIDKTTGQVVLSDQEVAGFQKDPVTQRRFNGAGVIYFPAANRAYVLYNGFSLLGDGLRVREIILPTLTLGPEVDLDNSSVLDNIDFVYTNKAGVGERVFVVYKNNTTDVGRVRAIDATGMIDTSIPAFTLPTPTAPRDNGKFAIAYNDTSDRLFVAYEQSGTGAPGGVYIQSLSFTSSTLIGVGNFLLQNFFSSDFRDSRTVNSVQILKNPIDQTRCSVLVGVRREADYSPTATPKVVNESFVQEFVVSATAVISNRRVADGMVPFALGHLDITRQTIYLPTERVEGTQSAAFVLDLYKGKAEDAAFSIARYNYLDHVSYRYQTDYLTLHRCVSFSDGRWLIPSRVLRPGQAPASLDESAFLLTGQTSLSASFCLARLDLTPEIGPSRQFFASNTYLSGGMLHVYDGDTIAEDNFLFAPETVQLQALSGSNAAIVAKIQDGTAGLPEITDVTLPCAALIPSNPNGNGRYWSFYDAPSNSEVRVWYRFTNESPPTPGILIRVDLTGNETATEVRRKTIEAIQASGRPVILTDLPAAPVTPGKFRIRNSNNGVVTDASGMNVAYPPTGLPAGSYQYCAVWAFTDRNGQTHRSKPSVPVSVTGTTFPVGIVINAPAITNRLARQVSVELYRTQLNQTTFYRVTSLDTQKTWSATETSVGYQDTLPDSELTKGLLLYTTGGVLENTLLSPCKALSLFKNRLLLSGKDANTLYYSKTGINGEPASFSDELFIRTENDSQPIVGHAQLDDKLVIFKQNQVEYRGGDGANDVGGQSSFSLPILAATDTGCINPNTIALYPNGLVFQSRLGVMVINRAMRTEYIGVQVDSFNTAKISRALTLLDNPELRQIRFTLSDQNLELVYDYLVGRWGLSTQSGGTDACLWRGDFCFVSSSGVVGVETEGLFEDTGAATPDYDPTLTTQWMKIKDVQDFQRVYRLGVLGELKSAHTLRFRLYYDYDNTNFDEYLFNSANISGTQPGDTVFQPQIHLRRQKCQAVKVEITALTTGAGSKECLTLADMAFEVGVKRGLFKVPAQKRL